MSLCCFLIHILSPICLVLVIVRHQSSDFVLTLLGHSKYIYFSSEQENDFSKWRAGYVYVETECPVKSRCCLLFQDYFISTSVDLQEQVHRVQKLHHMLEIMVSCTVLLQFKHENLFPLTQ